MSLRKVRRVMAHSARVADLLLATASRTRVTSHCDRCRLGRKGTCARVNCRSSLVGTVYRHIATRLERRYEQHQHTQLCTQSNVPPQTAIHSAIHHLLQPLVTLTCKLVQQQQQQQQNMLCNARAVSSPAVRAITTSCRIKHGRCCAGHISCSACRQLSHLLL